MDKISSAIELQDELRYCSQVDCFLTRMTLVIQLPRVLQ